MGPEDRPPLIRVVLERKTVKPLGAGQRVEPLRIWYETKGNPMQAQGRGSNSGRDRTCCEP